MTTSRLEAWRLRAAHVNDARAMADVANAASQALYGQNQTTEERLHHWLSGDDRDLEHGVRVLMDDAGDVIGWAEVEDPGEPYVQFETRLAMHPSAADQREAWERLLAWIEDRARSFVSQAPEGARIALTLDTMVQDERRIQAFEALGASQVRVLNRMRIDFQGAPPAPAWPDGVVLRTMDPENDLRCLGEASQEVFRDHWGMVEQSVDEEMRSWSEWIEFQGDGYDKTLSFLAMVDGDEGRAVAGFSLCRPHIAGDLDLGVLGSLGVRPAWRGRGLGLALITHSFAEFHRRGYKAVELLVDTGSLTGALRLYERAGMRPIRQQYVYEKELRSGKDLVTREL